jgi:hypothetical protein
MSTVTAYSATTDGSTALLNTSGFADVPGLSITVLGTAVGDVLQIQANLIVYTGGVAHNGKYTLLVDGVAVRTQVTYSTSDGGPKTNCADWTITLQAGDITGGNTIVKVQWAHYSLVDPNNLNILNSVNGVATLRVIQVRA